MSPYFSFTNVGWNDFYEFSKCNQNLLKKVIRKNKFSENVYASPFFK